MIRWAAIILLTTTWCAAQSEPAASDRANGPTTQPLQVPRTAQFDLLSGDNRPYRIFVAWPATPPPPQGYATLYVLDANAMFLTTLDAVRFQHGLVPTIVIGIGHLSEKLDQQARYFDFTPLTPDEHLLHSSTEPPVGAGGTGGQEPFFNFIQQTLRPEIARRWKIDPNRSVLFGHSLAGRFVLHTLFIHGDAFRDYIAASPSIWWDDRSVLKEAETFLAAKSDPHRLVLTIGEMEQSPAPGTPPARVEFFNKAKMVDNAQGLADQLKAIPSLTVSMTVFPQENHGSVVPFAIGRGVRLTLQPTTPAR